MKPGIPVPLPVSILVSLPVSLPVSLRGRVCSHSGMKPGISWDGELEKKGHSSVPRAAQKMGSVPFPGGDGKSRPGTEWRGWQGFGVAPFLAGALRTGAKLHRRLVVTDDPPIEP